MTRNMLLSAKLLTAILSVLVGVFACAPLPGEQPETEYPEMFRIECVGRARGCACSIGPPGDSNQAKKSAQTDLAGEAASVIVFHAEAATGLGSHGAYRQVSLSENRRCWYKTSALRAMPYAKVPLSPLRNLDHTPLPLKRLAPNFGAAQTDAKHRKDLGLYWATYYHLAVEDYHPGPTVPILDRSGRKLGTASQAFLKQVTWQGSGIASNGLRLHYTGTAMRFNTYAKDMWGHGAGYGYRVFPYRTIAVHFRALCRKLMPGRKCGKKDVIGTLVWIREVAAARAKMPGGSIHDGYFCATDTGSPNYIKDDRIDIFVGTHGGGNPYLPPARRPNALIDGGIQNLVPSDWRLWRGPNDRVWCDPNRLPSNSAKAEPGDCVNDYHVVARGKALRIEAVLDDRGRPLRCAKRP
ncbi:MAG: hypothetical protein RIF32_22135 [Leptospirales bacterium]|jgi:hypothetical protein